MNILLRVIVKKTLHNYMYIQVIKEKKMVTGKKVGRERLWESEGVIEESVDMCGVCVSES